MSVSVAISTTGDNHRMHLLRQCVAGWDAALDTRDSLFVTVDGTAEDAERVREAVHQWTASVLLIGGVGFNVIPERMMYRDGRLGVAANKNTGLEQMMTRTPAHRLWLSDDDSWPLSPASLVAHYNLGIPHSLVCWGRHHRATPALADTGPGYASWAWPRGAVMYVDREVVSTVGGMVEAFGHGGHEHVEWSNRIHSAGFTPAPYVSPLSYMDNWSTGAGSFWHCEDMSQSGETVASLVSRRRHLTTVRRYPEDQVKQDRIMDDMAGSTAYIDYHAEANGRTGATLLPVV